MRRSGTLYFKHATRSTPTPNAKPEYSSGSMPDMLSTLGSTMPQPKISSQPVPLHMRQRSPSCRWPVPPHTPQLTSASADGSVNGK